MMWHEKYLGIPYSEKNCSELLAHVLLNEFNLYRIGHVVLGVESLVSSNALNDYSAICQRTEKPFDGCGVVLSHGLDQGHVGVVVMVGDEVRVLHSMRERGSSLQRIPALTNAGYKIEGFYKWLS